MKRRFVSGWQSSRRMFAGFAAFSCTDGHELIPAIAAEKGLENAWLASGSTTIASTNELELQERDSQLRRKPVHVDILAVGNEVLLRGDLSGRSNCSTTSSAQSRQLLPGVDVGYVDAYFEFVDHPRITAKHATVAVGKLLSVLGRLSRRSRSAVHERDVPTRRATASPMASRIIVSETGWPNIGTAEGGSQSQSYENAIKYFVDSCRWAEEDEHRVVFYFSSFRRVLESRCAEGDVGAYWGLWDKDGKLKYCIAVMHSV